MSDGAALLREAAQTLREKAEAANRDMPAHWEPKVLSDGRAWVVADDDGFSMHGYPRVAPLIALMDPTVALAVADWLGAEAERVEFGASSRTHDGAPMFPPSPQALAVARAVLRRES